MVKVKRNLIGEVFGRLTVIKQVDDYIDPSGKHFARWLCKCSCGDDKYIEVTGTHLIGNQTRSCGCLKREKDIEKIIAQKENNHKFNTYDLTGNYGVGYCSNTGNPFLFDLEDYDKIKNYCWYEYCKNNYHKVLAKDCNNGVTITIYGLLVDYDICDHINRNTMDNRKSNLRPASHLQNSQNHSLRCDSSSGVSGVSFHKRDRIWQSYIDVNKQRVRLGSFTNKDEAIRARLDAEAKYFGEFAPQMHLFEQYGIKITGD
jgi:hypothetical protein